MNNTINVTCILTDEQMQRLDNISDALNNHSNTKKWDRQMTLQLAVGNLHLSEMMLMLLEGYIEENIKKSIH